MALAAQVVARVPLPDDKTCLHRRAEGLGRGDPRWTTDMTADRPWTAKEVDREHLHLNVDHQALAMAAFRMTGMVMVMGRHRAA